MKIGLFQFNQLFENIDENKSIINNLLSKQFDNHKILIFPELTLTAYTMNLDKFKDQTPNQIFYFQDLAYKYHTNIFAGILEYENSKFYNSLYHFDEYGNIITKYSKIHPFSYAKEHLYFTSGDAPIITEVDDFVIGLSICYDLRFPELFRLYAKERINLIINIANWPDKRIEHYLSLSKARAIENLSYFISVNRVGTDPYNTYNGFSGIFDPIGKDLGHIENVEGILTFDISSNVVDETRSRFHFLDDIKLI